MKVYDLKVDNDNNLVIKNGDFVVDDSTTEHGYAILATCKGEWRHDVKLGSDLVLELNNKMNNELRLKNKARISLEYDGFDTFKANFDIDLANNYIKMISEAERIRK